MANSGMRIKIIKLGQKLVNELSKGSEIDSLSKWMIHYISEQIRISKSTKGKKKLEAQRNCFETILKLWNHRAYLPSGQRPFENFEAIFRVLERMDPDNKKQYYYEPPIDKKTRSNKKKKIATDVKIWLDIALTIDEVARVWLSQVFKYAAQTATDKETIKWLNTASNLSKEEDISVISLLFGDESESEESKGAKIRKGKQDNLKARINQLDTFVKFSKNLKKIYLIELKKASS